MSLRNKLAERARPYLEPGEHIQAVFRAQSGLSPYWQFLVNFSILLIANITLDRAVGHAGFWLTWGVASAALLAVYFAFVRVRHVVVTDRAIVVLDASMWSTSQPTGLRLRHPRNFHFGAMSGLWGKFMLDNTEYWVHRRFRKDVATADAALARIMQCQPSGRWLPSTVRDQPRSLPPAGWYPDPASGSAMRYWDGERWGLPAQQARPY